MGVVEGLQESFMEGLLEMMQMHLILMEVVP